MQTVQNSILVLYTSLLTANSSNSYGSANTNFTDLTFTNINIRQILGDNYNKYYKFNLILNSVVIPTNVAGVSAGNDSTVLLYMSGLPFDVSTSYSIITGTTSSSVLCGDYKLATRGNVALNSDVQTFAPTFFNTFLRPSNDIVDITINLRSSIATLTSTGATFILNSTIIYPRCAYCFNIVPVLNSELLPFPCKEEQTLIYRQRLIKS
jgi:hypothetical protein